MNTGPYSKRIALPKQFDVLFQLLHRPCLLLFRRNERRNVMLLLNQRTNQHLKMVTQLPTRIIHLVIILIETFPITRVFHLLRSTFLHWVNPKVWIWPQREKTRSRRALKNRSVPLEWKGNKTNLLLNTGHAFRTFKKVLKNPLWGYL